MSHKMVRPFIVKVSVLGYFPLYDYIYYCDFKILFNLLIPQIKGLSVFGTHIRIIPIA